VPLPLDDEARQDIPVEPKEYIIQIGTMAADFAFERFVAFAVQGLKEDWLPSRHSPSQLAAN
jgi:hypothetical protein